MSSPRLTPRAARAAARAALGPAPPKCRRPRQTHSPFDTPHATPLSSPCRRAWEDAQCAEFPLANPAAPAANVGQVITLTGTQFGPQSPWARIPVEALAPMLAADHFVRHLPAPAPDATLPDETDLLAGLPGRAR